MDPCHTLQTGTRPKRTRGEHCFLITLMILSIAGLFVLLNASCTMCTWSVKPISTISDQCYLHVLWRWACHTAHHTKPMALRDRRSLTGKVGSPHGINTYLALSCKHAKALKKTNCWVCTKIPHSAVTGILLLAIPFNLSEWCGYWAKEKN